MRNFKGVRKQKSGKLTSFFYYDDDIKFICTDEAESIEEALFWQLFYIQKFDKKYPDTEIYYTSKSRAIINKIIAAKRKHGYYRRKDKEKNEKHTGT